jgi:transcriptional regulator with XRE-family HTH domain
MPKFIIRLKHIHDASGLSMYRVCKMAGITSNTARKYLTSDEVEATRFDVSVVKLCKVYGVDWKDPTIIRFEEADDESGQQKTLLAAV